ncbi:MAG: hypothetical protein JWM68_5222 [Verrucomicrobiales bacterium]|nr:hypothetical protein [Verrucomicrobiales bacterium]
MNLDLPPLHPALVHFPIALVTISFVFDLLGRMFHRRSFHSAGWWTLCAAAITGLITIPLGYFDMNRAALDESTHEVVDIHLKIGWMVLIAVAGLTLWRWWIRLQAERVPGGGYLAAAALAMCLTLFQGWYGGEMVYSHGAGVAAAEQGTQTAERGQRSLRKVNAALSKIPGFASVPSHHHDEINESAGAVKKPEDEHK